MRKILDVLASPLLMFYLLPWLMFLLIGGTVAERYIGLFASEKLFFGAYVLWLGPVPLPGVYTALGLLTLSLLAKLLLKSPWKKEQAGVILAHASVLVLLLGGFVTAGLREEAYMVLGPGETSDTVLDYHRRELAIRRNGAALLTTPYEKLSEGGFISDKALPFNIQVVKRCENCAMLPRKSASPELRGAAKDIDLAALPPAKQDEENRPGAVFAVSGKPDINGSSIDDISPASLHEIAGTYVTVEQMPQQPSFTLGKDRYDILMRSAERKLPFSLRLLDFKRTAYPGTDIAASYRSDVAVKDGLLEWNATIAMNAPLHYKGYTVYQSSFVDNGDKEMTVLAIVHTLGQFFPYVALGMLCAGLGIHLVTIRFAQDLQSHAGKTRTTSQKRFKSEA